MRLSLVDSPRQIAHIPKFQHVLLRVMSGDVLIGRDRQDLTGDNSGLPIGTGDGLVTLDWDAGPLWMRAAAGTVASVEVVVPSS